MGYGRPTKQMTNCNRLLTKEKLEQFTSKLLGWGQSLFSSKWVFTLGSVCFIYLIEEQSDIFSRLCWLRPALHWYQGGCLGSFDGLYVHARSSRKSPRWDICNWYQGRSPEKKLLFFWFLSKWGGGEPAQIYLAPFHKCILVNKRSLFPLRCQ